MTSTQLIWFVLTFTLVIPVLIWLQQTGNFSVYFDGTSPPGQLAYIISKLMGMLALALIAGQMILSLCQRLALINIQWLGRAHRYLGLGIVLCAASHLLLFFIAVTLRQESPAFSLFLLDFRDFYHTHLSFGLLGLWLLIVVAVIGRLRRLRDYRWLAKYHSLYWVVTGFVYFHALAVGSESQSLIGLLFYSVLGVAIVALGFLSLVRKVKMQQTALP